MCILLKPFSSFYCAIQCTLFSIQAQRGWDVDESKKMYIVLIVPNDTTLPHFLSQKKKPNQKCFNQNFSRTLRSVKTWDVDMKKKPGRLIFGKHQKFWNQKRNFWVKNRHSKTSFAAWFLTTSKIPESQVKKEPNDRLQRSGCAFTLCVCKKELIYCYSPP